MAKRLPPTPTEPAQPAAPRWAQWLERPRRTPLLAFVVAVVAQSWILGLSFQLDDYRLLEDPFGIFAANRTAYDAPEAAGYEPFMLRWTAWAFWGFLRPIAGEPVSPLPFHLAGLLLHGATAALLTGLVRRLIPTSSAALALAAGAYFGVAAGGIQAVSWTSAHPDLLATFFGLLALTLFLRARDRHKGVLRSLGALSLFAALVSKTPAIVLAPVVATLLWFSTRDRRQRRREGAWLLATIAAAGASRWLYLGTLRLRYFETEPPAPGEWAAQLWSALGLLGQSLVPWNRDALFGAGTFTGPIVAALVFVPPIAYALFRSQYRKPLLGALAATLVLALPGATLYAGTADNALSRTTYLPWVALAVALAVSAHAWFQPGRGRGPLVAGRPLVGSVLLTVWLVTAAFGLNHVAHTEKLASDNRETTRAAVATAVQATAAAGGGRLQLLVVSSGAGFAGIPDLGPHLGRATRVPFADVPADVQLELLEFPSEQALAARLATLPLSGASVQALGPERAPAAADAETARAARVTRPWSELVHGWSVAPDVRWALTSDGPGSELWIPEPPIPMHEIGVLACRFPPGASGRGELVVHQGEARRTLEVAFDSSGNERLVQVAPAANLESRLGPALTGLTWSWGSSGRPLLGAPELSPRLPTLRPESPIEGASLELVGAAAPEFTLPLEGSPLGGANSVRLELEVALTTEPLVVFADMDLPTGLRPPAMRIAPAHWHAEPDLAPGAAPAAPVGWAEFSAALRTSLEGQRRNAVYARWRVVARHPGGALSAVSEFRGLFLTLPTGSL